MGSPSNLKQIPNEYRLRLSEILGDDLGSVFRVTCYRAEMIKQ
jgi:hypothetical protein